MEGLARRTERSSGRGCSFAAHLNTPGYYGATEITGHPDDKWGWAAQLALSIKNIPTGAGDTINVQGVYTDGATRYNIQDLAPVNSASRVYGIMRTLRLRV